MLRPNIIADLDDLIHELQHLPLALNNAGAYIDASQITLRDYLQLWRSDFRAVTEHAHFRGASNYEARLFTTWEVSLTAMGKEDERSGTCAADLLLVLAFFNPHVIDQKLFECKLSIKKYRIF